MPDLTKYQGLLHGRNRRWTFQLRHENAILVTDDHDISLTSSIQWGQDSPNRFFDRLIMPSTINFTITDPGGVIYNDLDTSSQFRFTLRIFDETLTYEMEMFVKLAESFSPLKTDLATPETRLIGYCGLTRLPNINAFSGAATLTLHEVFKELLVTQLREQDILYTYGTQNERTGINGSLITQLRWPDLAFAYKGTDQDAEEIEPAGDQLTDYAEAFQVIVFNDLFFGKRWRVAQQWLNGLDISIASRLAALYDHGAGTVTEVAFDAQLETLIVTDDTLKGRFDGVHSVIINVGKKTDAFTDTKIDKGKLSEGWVAAGNNIFWIETAAGTFIETTEGGFIEDGGNEIHQDQLLVQEGTPIQPIPQFEYAMEYTLAGVGTHEIEWQYQAVPIDTSKAVQYADGASPSLWTETPTTLGDSIRTPDANGTLPASLTWYSLLKIVKDPMPFDGYLRLRILGDTGTDFFLHLRNFDCLFRQESTNKLIPPHPGRIVYSEIGGTITEGDVIKYERPWHAYIQERTTDFIQMEVDVNGLGLWEETNRWTDPTVPGEGPFSDMSEYTARMRLARSGAGGRLLRGTFLGILTPGHALFNTVYGRQARFLPIYLNVDLHTETTQFLVYENLISLR